MSDETIMLDPDLFMALGLSAAAHGGVGSCVAFVGKTPCCIVGHATWLDGQDEIHEPDAATATERELWDASPWSWRDDPRVRLTRHNDAQVLAITNRKPGRVSFTRWCQVVGADVRDA